MENSDELFQENKQSIIYSGSRILQLDQLKCIVIRTSFDTLKGNLLRSIMFPLKPNQFSFQKQSMKFIIILGFNALIAFLITIPKFIELLDQQAILPVDVVIRILDLITISVPPALPTCLAFGVSFSLRRLKKQNIFCINPPKINACGKVKTVCFDKTGTLTEEGLSFKRIICYEKKELKEIEALNLIEMGNYIHRIIISACHTIENFNNELIGDPLDIEMFKYSGFYIAESGQNGQILVEKNTQKLKIQILKRFQFLAELQKASVIAEFEGNKYIFSKGSPEKIVQQCKQESIPHNYKEVLEQYTLSGYRVIGISFSEIQNFQEGEKRDYYEKNHVFAGFLIFENELKDVTKYHINLLNSQNIRSIMVTGDNPLTATYVAKQCDIIEFEQQSNILEYLNNECILNNKKFEIEKKLDQLDGKQLTVTGTFFKQYIEDNFNLRRFILKNTKVYARMTPDQKQNLISFIQQENENVHTFTGMCGDGANDCGALKEADMGISLSNTDTSIAAPFTSKVQNIACVHRLLREGRASLQTSFECFKYMALYSIIQCFTTTILYYQQSFPADKQFLMWDLFIILPLSFLLGMGKPSQKLKKQTPTCELISAEVIISIIGQSAIQLGVQLFTIGILVKQSWYMNTLDINKDSDGEINYDNLSGCYDSTALYWYLKNIYIYI
ncbi:hypothetical protein IMG5_205740 [Ichthyophthirius multifiliis]|uniref:Uncharacterized protein n=1 Tax=Ichthyophthirius multifiliis TaxID=5932 RepID=G0R6K1_ICHMU|nr:hypothetical protein IMG5_205740 [Ichthyophthirius multifiliis]EGR26894.1 hypothetical protein IMG5_205740 [Ichthyophthirius multifiliis]|eukprot:XP_004023778.1 hypothetical protein IMG5_205740 [Ichthyophthirius multifiliis]